GCTYEGTPGVCQVDDEACPGTYVGGRCPGPANFRCCVRGLHRDGGSGATCNPLPMPTPNAGLTEAPGEGGCPAGMVHAGTVCIDKYEAALVVVADDGSTSSWSPYFNPGDRRVRAVSLAGAVPQGYISGTQAAAACAEAGKRLCTDTEWKRACQGPDGFIYPY